MVNIVIIEKMNGIICLPKPLQLTETTAWIVIKKRLHSLTLIVDVLY